MPPESGGKQGEYLTTRLEPSGKTREWVNREVYPYVGNLLCAEYSVMLKYKK